MVGVEGSKDFGFRKGFGGRDGSWEILGLFGVSHTSSRGNFKLPARRMVRGEFRAFSSRPRKANRTFRV